MRRPSNAFPRFLLAAFASSSLLVCGLPALGDGPPKARAEGDAVAQQTVVVPAAGRHDVTFRVPHFGRWSVSVESEQGASLQIVDKVSGPGPVAGTPGVEDGRRDVFLDRGEIKVVVRGHEEAAGEAEVSLRPFVEQRARALRLPELSSTSTELGDLEEVSWWIELPREQRVILEAAGRHLADLRVWRDGTWMVGAEPEIEIVTPATGRPLRLCRLSTVLPPGLYELKAYGGPSLPWAEDDGAAGEGNRPLHLRSGVAKRAEAGRRKLEISPFGFDRFLVPASATYFRLEAPDGDLRGEPPDDGLWLDVGDWDESRPFAGDGEAGLRIHKELRELAVETRRPSRQDGWRVVEVRGTAGQPYALQHFYEAAVYPFDRRGDRSGEHWIDTIRGGHPADAVESTAVLLDVTHGIGDKERAVDLDAVPLYAGMDLERRFNLLAPASVFLQVRHGGAYEFSLGGVRAEVRLEPYIAPGTRSEEQTPPPWRDGEEVQRWDLDPGLYVLEMKPLGGRRGQGVATLNIRDAGSSMLPPGLERDPPLRPTARLGVVRLQHGRDYLLHRNQVPGPAAGVIVRALPIDLHLGLPFVLGHRDDVLELPFRIPGAGVLRAISEEGDQLEISVGGGEWTPEPSFDGGHAGRLRVRAVGSSGEPVETPVFVSLEWLAEHEVHPLPELPSGRLEALPELPVLDAAAERHLELGRRDRSTHLVTVDEPALYRLESTGLLDTAGVIRTRVQPAVERATDGGSGRNFLIQRWLGAGDYQLTVETRGRSRGPLGLRLARAPLRAAGSLRPGETARGWIEPGEALAYEVVISEEARDVDRWRIRALGLGTDRASLFPVRVDEIDEESGDAWPVMRPGLRGDLELDLRPGRHRLVVLPRTVRARHLVRIDPVEKPTEREGHGPFDLELAQTAFHRWSDPGAVGARDPETWSPEPDRWRFELSAPVELEVKLAAPEGGAVEAELVRLAAEGTGDGEFVGRLPPGRGFEGEVPAGRYELRVRPSRPNNRLAYELTATPRQLLPGYAVEERFVSGQTRTWDLRLGEPSLVAVESFGRIDVRARLLDDGDGSELARSDDRPGDWNFRLVRRLEPGEYGLEVTARGAAGDVRIAVAALEETTRPALETGGEVARESFEPRGSVHLLPLRRPAEEGLVMARAESAEGLRLTLEARAAGIDQDSGWTAVAEDEGMEPELAFAANPGQSLRLRLEGLDRGASPATVEARWLGVEGRHVADEADLARGLRPRELLGDRTAVAVRLDRPGCFALPGGRRDLEAAGFPGRALRRAPDLAAGGNILWLAFDARRGVRAERWSWRADEETRRIRLRGDEVARCDLGLAGPALLRVRGLGGAAVVTLPDRTDSGAVQAARGDATFALAEPDRDFAAVSVPDFAASHGPREIELGAAGFERTVDPEPHGVLGRGFAEGGVEPGTSASRDLPSAPAGDLRLRLVLGEGLAAALRGADGLHSLHVAGMDGSSILQRLPAGDATRLEIIHPRGDTDGVARYAIELVPEEGDALLPLTPERPFERRSARRGRIDLAVSAVAVPTRLQVRGGESATFLGADGSLVQAEGDPATLDLPAGGGRLVVEHGRGFVAAWLGDAIWSGEDSMVTVDVAVPAAVALSGRSAAFRVAPAADSPQVLHLRAATPALVAVGDRVTLHSDALREDVFLEAGEATSIRLRGLGGEPLGGELEITSSPVVETGEGLGPELILGPGATRYASFRVERAGRVGVGVRAESEVVGIRLLDAGGRPVGPGESADRVLQMAELEPGVYLLALHLDAGERPVRARPAVVGLERPSTLPPPEVRRRYLEMARSEDER